jgi:hypothetical protein
MQTCRSCKHAGRRCPGGKLSTAASRMRRRRGTGAGSRTRQTGLRVRGQQSGGAIQRLARGRRESPQGSAHVGSGPCASSSRTPRDESASACADTSRTSSQLDDTDRSVAAGHHLRPERTPRTNCTCSEQLGDIRTHPREEHTSSQICTCAVEEAKQRKLQQELQHELQQLSFQVKRQHRTLAATVFRVARRVTLILRRFCDAYDAFRATTPRRATRPWHDASLRRTATLRDTFCCSFFRPLICAPRNLAVFLRLLSLFALQHRTYAQAAAVFCRSHGSFSRFATVSSPCSRFTAGSC